MDAFLKTTLDYVLATEATKRISIEIAMKPTQTKADLERYQEARHREDQSRMEYERLLGNTYLGNRYRASRAEARPIEAAPPLATPWAMTCSDHRLS